jgi:SprT-like protein
MTKADLLAEQSRLLALANELARRHWGVDYTGTLRLTRRYWRQQEACYAWALDLSRQEIRMSTTVNAEIGAAKAEGNLLHELVHWRLNTLGLPFDDTDSEFIAECIRVGAPISMDRRAQVAYKLYLRRNGLSEEAA